MSELDVLLKTQDFQRIVQDCPNILASARLRHSGKISARAARLARRQLVPRAQGKTEAIQQLSRGLKRERHAVDYTAAVLRLDPEWEPLKTEPEFADLIAEAETVERSSDPTAKKRSAEVNPPEKTGAKK